MPEVFVPDYYSMTVPANDSRDIGVKGNDQDIAVDSERIFSIFHGLIKKLTLCQTYKNVRLNGMNCEGCQDFDKCKLSDQIKKSKKLAD